MGMYYTKEYCLYILSRWQLMICIAAYDLHFMDFSFEFGVCSRMQSKEHI